MKTKTSIAVDLYRAGEKQQALKIVAGFRMLSDKQKNAFKSAYAAMTNRRFYLQIKSEAWVTETINTGLLELESWVSSYEQNV